MWAEQGEAEGAKKGMFSGQRLRMLWQCGEAGVVQEFVFLVAMQVMEGGIEVTIQRR